MLLYYKHIQYAAVGHLHTQIMHSIYTTITLKTVNDHTVGS